MSTGNTNRNQQDLLDAFLRLQLRRDVLDERLGSALYDAAQLSPLMVRRADLQRVVQNRLNGSITRQQLTEWVNTIWFTDAFLIAEEDAESMISVLEPLEELAEDGLDFSEAQYQRMLQALADNTEFDLQTVVS